MRNVLITGANRGIGLEFARQFAALRPAPKHIFATCRRPEEATELIKLASEAEESGCTVHILPLDVSDYEKIDGLVEKVDAIVGADGLNILLNNAGIYYGPDGLADLEADKFTRTLAVMVIGRAMLTKKFWPLLRRAAALNKDGTFRAQKAAVIEISSLYGSVEDCHSGGSISYRCSKSAVNMLSRCASIDMRADEILAVSISPGAVKTDMSEHQGKLEAKECVEMMMETIAKLNESHNGKFIDYQCKLLPY